MKNYLLSIWLLSLFYCVSLMAQDFTVLNPNPGDAINPNSFLQIDVDVAPEILNVGVGVLLGNGLNFDTTQFSDYLEGSPTHSGVIWVPPELKGEVTLGVWLYDLSSGDALGDHDLVNLTLKIVPIGPPVSLKGRDTQTLQFPDSLNSEPNSNVSLRATFAEGNSYRLAPDILPGATYTVRDPEIIDVALDGQITTKEVGHTLIRSQYSGLEWYTGIKVIPERVADSDTDTTPPLEVTADMGFQYSGFRKDLTENLFKQSVVIANNSVWPIPNPAIVISGLPSKISIRAKNKTRVVMPVGSPVIEAAYFLKKDPGKLFALMPGESTTVILDFYNPKNQPITYQVRVFETRGGI